MPVSQTFTEGADVYVVESEDTYTLNFLGGADRLDVRTGSVTASMGSGNDLVIIRGGTITAAGGADADRFNFYAPASDFELHGDAGDDDFFGYGHELSGIIYGDSGNDYFVNFSSSLGAVTLQGGLGNDIYRYHAGTAAVLVETPNEGIDSVQVARGVSYTLGANFERISVSGFGGSNLTAASTLTGNDLANAITAHNNPDTLHGLGANDRLFGKGADDQIYGGDGHDFLDGGTGNDLLEGGSGNDVLNGRAGNDIMAGGTGNDSYYVDSVGDVIQESEDGGVDLVRSSSSHFTMPEWVENGTTSGSSGPLYLHANGLDNILNGSAARDYLYGMDGNDRVYGGAGDDRLLGGDGSDFLEGGAGRDRIDGDTSSDMGEDVIVGGLGGDWLEGGYGSDRFVYTSVQDSLPTPSGYPDQVLFASGSDLIDLSAIDADATQYGNQAFAIVDSPSGSAGELWWVFEDLVTEGELIQEDYYVDLYVDVDGDGAADMHIDMTVGYGGFTGSDLVL